MEQNNNSKEVKKALWLLVGIPAVAVLILVGLLIYNHYVDNKDVTNIKTEEKDPVDKEEHNTEEDENSEGKIDLTGYTEIDITEQNIYPIYKRYENDSFTFNLPNNLSYEGKFIIENNKLYFGINGEKYVINIDNPKKVVIGDYGIDNTYTLMVLADDGVIYTVYLNPNYDINDNNLTANKVISEFISEANKNIEQYYNLNNVDNISAILNSYGVEGSEWEDLYFTYTINNEEMIIKSVSLHALEHYPAQNIKEFSLDIGPVYIKYDNTVYDYNENKLNIKPKYLLKYIPETGHGAFLDEENYLYVSTYEENENMKKGKVAKVYKSNDKYRRDIIVKFTDGTYKKLSEYENW